VLLFIRYRGVLVHYVIKGAFLVGLGLALRPLEQLLVELPSEDAGLDPPVPAEPPNSCDDVFDEQTLHHSLGS
jgi:hypothetical protein